MGITTSRTQEEPAARTACLIEIDTSYAQLPVMFLQIVFMALLFSNRSFVWPFYFLTDLLYGPLMFYQIVCMALLCSTRSFVWPFDVLTDRLYGPLMFYSDAFFPPSISKSFSFFAPGNQDLKFLFPVAMPSLTGAG